MKTRTVVERIGEHLGPVDWSYDFTQLDWGQGRGGVNPECSARAKELLRQLEADATSEWWVMMHQNFRRVLCVGMYDGWPFWKPTPSVQTTHVLGAEWHPWYDIQAIERRNTLQRVDRRRGGRAWSD